jgi:hypothetical protein
MRSVNSHEFDLLYCDRSLFTLYYTADNVNFKSKVIYGHVHVSHGRKGHHMVYDNAFHMYFAKQEAISTKKDAAAVSPLSLLYLTQRKIGLWSGLGTVHAWNQSCCLGRLLQHVHNMLFHSL